MAAARTTVAWLVFLVVVASGNKTEDKYNVSYKNRRLKQYQILIGAAKTICACKMCKALGQCHH